MLPARHRLRTSAEFSAAVRGAGAARAGGPLLVLHAIVRSPEVQRGGTNAPGAIHPPRAGFVVSKAVGSAVTRNRTKRVLRHLVAARLAGMPDGTDLVVRANPAAAQAATAELAAELDALLPRLVRRLAPAPMEVTS